MKKFLLACCLFAAAGCDASKQVEEYADKACACKDKDCAKTVWNEFIDWAEKNKDARGNEDKAEAAMKRMGECVVNAGIDQKVFMDGVERLQKLAN